jgi:hypothetical protein
VRIHGGDARDDRTHNPFVDSDPAKGIDSRILNQWEEWLRLMDANDMESTGAKVGIDDITT